MPELSLEQLTRIRLLLGAFSSSFTDEEIGNYALVAWNTAPDTYLDGVLAWCFYALMTGAVTLVNFKQGDTAESQQIIYDRLSGLYNHWAVKAGYADGMLTVKAGAMRMHYIEFPEDGDRANE